MATKHMRNTQEEPINHGGAVDFAARRYGIPPHEWLDLSTGINPVAYPVGTIDAAFWQRLPLASELDQLKHAAKSYYNVTDTCHLVCAPGTQALIQNIPFWLRDQTPDHSTADVHIIGPTYGEHERCWARAGYHCQIHDSTPKQRHAKIQNILNTSAPGSVVVLVNPNNPDGTLFAPDDVAEFAKQALARQCWLLVDEAFMDCQPDLSLCSRIGQLPNTIILRSFGKFFGLAGVRLGFAVMAAELADDLGRRIGPWAIPGPTIAIGIKALQDTAWHQQTRGRLASDSLRLDTLITRHSKLVSAGTTDLFRYYDGAQCIHLADQLARRGILIRLFDHDPNKVRFGFPGTASQWNRLEKAMAGFTS